MKWNFRVVQFTVNGETHKEICEVHYNQDGEPIAYCPAQVAWSPNDGQSGLELLKMMGTAFNKDTLTQADLKEENVEPDKEQE